MAVTAVTRAHMTSTESSVQPTLLTVLASVAHRALTDVRVPLVDARASILAPVGFTIVPLSCTACNSGKPLLCMVSIKKKALNDCI